jgi:hypothetical protein
MQILNLDKQKEIFMGFSKNIVEKVLLDSGRYCSLCHKFCGTKIELHHIKQKADGGEDSYENAIPLCFDCHAEVGAYNPKHPKGRKYTESELKSHRDKWYEKQCNSVQKIESNLQYRKLDTNLMHEIKFILNDSGTISFLRINNFAGFSYERSKTDSLHKFENLCNFNPEFEFLDADLEALKGSLYSAIAKLTDILAFNTWPIKGDSRLSSVPEEWEFEQPKRFWEVVNKIHNLTIETTKCYDNLIKTARRKLIV